MSNFKDNQITIIGEDGTKKIMNILFTYENEERQKKYVFFFDPEKEEEIITMSYTDEGDLFPIDDDEEYNEVEEVFNAYNEDPEIQKNK